MKWYLNRLLSLSLLEIPYRLVQLIKKYIDSIYTKNLRYKPQLLAIEKRILPISTLDTPVFEPYVSVFGRKFNYDVDPINWHKDIFSNKEFPVSFAKSINIRSDNELSAKNVWEINRLAFLPQLAVNYKKTGQEKYLTKIISVISSWSESNPYLMGVNWYSNIEVNIRLINWFFCWEILDIDELSLNRPEVKKFVDDIWIPLIYQHCKYAISNPSKFSSANNHLISEYAGLFIASSKWKFKESAYWLSHSKEGLEKEIVKQHSSGINREEAAEYIQFITDFFVLPYVIAQYTNQPFSSSFTLTLRQILDYVNEFLDVKGNFPKYGDEDDGKVINLSTDAHFNNFKSLLTTACILFDDAKYKAKSAGYDVKNQVLFGQEGELSYGKLINGQEKQGSRFYTAEGHYFFKKQSGNKEIYLHFDAAPLGYLSIAAHGHSDALAFLLNINGQEVFVDPGTYSYHVSKDLREYFVSAVAHNTICIDNKNQANHAADTLWLDHYTCKLIDSSLGEQVDYVKASHNGYKNVVHTRSIEFQKGIDLFLIKDQLKFKDNRKRNVFVPFHFHPSIVVELIEANTALITHGTGMKILLKIKNSNLAFNQAKGQKDPLLGWYSESFMKIEPATVLFINFFADSDTELDFEIKVLEY